MSSNSGLLERVLVIGGIVLAIVLLFLAIASPYVSWLAWTGFADYTTPKSDALDYHRGKTLWDWLGLLVVPAVLVLGGYLFSRAERASDNAIAERRIEEERRIAEERRLEDRKIAEEQRLEDRRIEAERIAEEHRLQDDRIRDALLREYLDRMSDLLITHKLGTSKEGDPKQLVARARTVTILNALSGDGARKGNIVRFLYEAKLLNKDNPIVNLQGADLTHADLTVANLSEANLSEANLRNANLRNAILIDANLRNARLMGANLSEAIVIGSDLSGALLIEADLSEADLSGVTLSEATLISANLIGADLSEADLSAAYLGRADLSGADLSEARLDNADLRQALLTKANLKDARVTREQLESAASLEGAILPDHINLTGTKP